jgi:hypothetical protein
MRIHPLIVPLQTRPSGSTVFHALFMKHHLFKVQCLAWPLYLPFVVCLCIGNPGVTNLVPIPKHAKITLFNRQEMKQPTVSTTQMQTDVVTLYGFESYRSVRPIGTAAAGDKTTYVVQEPGITCRSSLEFICKKHTDGYYLDTVVESSAGFDAQYDEFHDDCVYDLPASGASGMNVLCGHYGSTQYYIFTKTDVPVMSTITALQEVASPVTV